MVEKWTLITNTRARDARKSSGINCVVKIVLGFPQRYGNDSDFFHARTLSVLPGDVIGRLFGITAGFRPTVAASCWLQAINSCGSASVLPLAESSHAKNPVISTADITRPLTTIFTRVLRLRRNYELSGVRQMSVVSGQSVSRPCLG